MKLEMMYHVWCMMKTRKINYQQLRQTRGLFSLLLFYLVSHPEAHQDTTVEDTFQPPAPTSARRIPGERLTVDDWWLMADGWNSLRKQCDYKYPPTPKNPHTHICLTSSPPPFRHIPTRGFHESTASFLGGQGDLKNLILTNYYFLRYASFLTTNIKNYHPLVFEPIRQDGNETLHEKKILYIFVFILLFMPIVLC